MDLEETLKRHKLWLEGKEDGKRANLQGANLCLSSGIPYCCGGTEIKVDDRLVYQMIYHLTRQDTSECSPAVREFLAGIPKEIRNGFCKFRDDLKEQ